MRVPVWHRLHERQENRALGLPEEGGTSGRGRRGAGAGAGGLGRWADGGRWAPFNFHASLALEDAPGSFREQEAGGLTD